MQIPSDQRPIFVIGSARSGTTIITQALLSATGIPGFSEGHFLSFLSLLRRAHSRHFQSRGHLMGRPAHGIAHIDKDTLWTDLLQVVVNHHANTLNGDVWLDKTPDGTMMDAIPDLLLAWPKARLIVARRRGIEAIDSRMRKFPHVDFAQHCRSWTATMKTWIELRSELDAVQFLEVEQRRIALNPEAIAAQLGAFLLLESDHQSTLARYLAERQPEKTTTGPLCQSTGIHDIGWSADKIDCFRESCGEVNAQLGYSEDESYFLTGV